MAAASPEEELGNPYDWSEFYWGGFQPSMIGAVPIVDAFSKDDTSVINTILDATREKLKEALKNDDFYAKNEVKFEDYYVTIHDEYEDAQNMTGTLQKNDEQKSDDKQTNKDKTDNDNKAKQPQQQRREITVARIWHKNVFIGVRGSGKANPGQFNFVAKFDAKSGKFISMEKWQD